MLERGTFAGGHGVGLRAHQPKVIRGARLCREVVHLVIQKYARARDHNFGAERGVERGGAGHPGALRIGGREVGGMLAEVILLSLPRVTGSVDNGGVT